MKTLKKGTLLAVVLLMATILVTGCFSEPEGYTPPDGMGAVRLDMDIDAARATFLPGTTLDDFTAFLVTFTPAIGAPTNQTWDNKLATPKRSGTFVLEPGGYTLDVIAYMGGDATTPTNPGATATVGSVTTPINIVAGPNPGINVTLRAYEPGTTGETGTFVWNITNDGLSNLTAATMNVKEISDTGAGTTYNLRGGTGTNVWAYPAGVSLATGFYYVTFSITAGSPAITRTFQHILHIYRNQTTTVSYLFNDDVLGIVSTSVVVTIISYDPPTATPPAVQKEIEDDPDPIVTAVAAGDEVTVTRGVNDTTLSLSNAGSYASIVWWFNGTAIPGATCLVDTIATTSALYNISAGRYPLSVTGTTPVVPDNPYSGAPSSTEIFIIFVVP
jgi:hypothetical protein